MRRLFGVATAALRPRSIVPSLDRTASPAFSPLAPAADSATDAVADAVVGYPPDPDAARDALSGLERALANGMIETALGAAVSAIRLDPGGIAGYRALAQVLETQGHYEEARRAWQLQLHEDTVARLFAPAERFATAPPPSSASSSVQRHACHGPSSVAMVVPVALEGCAPKAVDKDRIDSPGGFVDRIDGARVWQDALNTRVLDADGRELTEHAHGNAALVERLASGRTPRVPHGGRLILLGAPGTGNFYHWMLDILPKLALLGDAGFNPGPDDRFVLPFFKRRFQAESLALLGIDESQLIVTERTSLWLEGEQWLVPWLRNRMGLSMDAWTPRALRRLFGVGPERDGPSPGTRLFIARDPAASQGRRVTNQAELERTLERRGITPVYPERLSLREQIDLFASAELIVAPHGAGLSNIVFCAPGTTVVECVGRHYQPCYRAICTLAGLHYALLGDTVKPDGDPDERAAAERHPQRQTADLSIDPDALERLLDRIEGDSAQAIASA